MRRVRLGTIPTRYRCPVSEFRLNENEALRTVPIGYRCPFWVPLSGSRGPVQRERGTTYSTVTASATASGIVQHSYSARRGTLRTAQYRFLLPLYIIGSIYRSGKSDQYICSRNNQTLPVLSCTAREGTFVYNTAHTLCRTNALLGYSITGWKPLYV